MSELWLGDNLVWENYPDLPWPLSHFAIKLRKQIAEDAVIERMLARAARRRYE